MTIVDDFAHHPTAIRETLKALRAAYPGAEALGRSGATVQHTAKKCL